MPALSIAEPIQLNDGEYLVIEHANPFVRLRRTSTGETVDMHLTELASRVVGFPPASVVGPRTFDRLSKEQTATALDWAEHIEELLTGVNPDYPDGRDEYSLALSLNERIITKQTELLAKGSPVSRSTLFRKMKTYQRDGAAAFIDKRVLRSDGPLANLDSAVRDALCVAIGNATKRSSGTKSRIIDEARAELIRAFGKDKAPAMPSRSALYRYIDILTKGKHTSGSAKTRQSSANTPDRTFEHTSENLPGAQVQVDSTPMDILVKSPSGDTVRPTLTIMLDIATRSILASTIRLDATKAIDHVWLLAQALTPPANRPDVANYRQLVQDDCPQASLLDPAERSALEAGRPFVYPRRIMMDNGKDYVGAPFITAAKKFGIGVTFSAPRTPTDKGHVERTFHSINTLFTQHLPGYVGKSPDNRGEAPEKENLLTVEALFELFDDWVLKSWQHRPHGGLRDRMRPSIKLSPNQAYLAASEVTSTLHLPLAADDYIELLPSEYRVISKTGIEYDSRYYDSAELHPLRNQKSNIALKRGKWEIKADPYRPLVVWVRSRENTWIQCRARGHADQFDAHATQFRPGEAPTDRALVAAVNAARTGVPAHNIYDDAPAESPHSINEPIHDFIEVSTFDPDKD